MPKPEPHPTNASEKDSVSITDDPLVFASILNNSLFENNPFQRALEDQWKKVMAVIQLKQNMSLKQEQVDKLNQQLERTQTVIERSTRSETGSRFDMMR